MGKHEIYMNKSGNMDYLNRIEKAITFVESNLESGIRLQDVAREACFSKYHFTRIFHALVGETMWSYVRKRRLTKASEDLIQSKEPISSIAYKYQFESPESFTRSFKGRYHQTPGQYRKKQTYQVAFNRSRLTARRLRHLDTGIQNEPKIKKIDGFHVIGIEGKSTLVKNQLYDLWNVFLNRLNEIKTIATPDIYFEVHPYQNENELTDYTEDTEFKKIASVGVRSPNYIPVGMKSCKVQGGKYAVFTHHGPIPNLQMSYDYIWGTWLSTSGHYPDERDDFERYDRNRFKGLHNPNTEVDIYVPLK